MREVTLIVGCRHMGHRVTQACTDLKEGDGLILAREPENPFDANAIVIHNIFGQPVGYVQREVATIVARWMDEGYLVSAKVIQASKFIRFIFEEDGIYSIHKYPRAAIYREDPPAEKTTTRTKEKLDA